MKRKNTIRHLTLFLFCSFSLLLMTSCAFLSEVAPQSNDIRILEGKGGIPKNKKIFVDFVDTRYTEATSYDHKKQIEEILTKAGISDFAVRSGPAGNIVPADYRIEVNLERVKTRNMGDGLTKVTISMIANVYDEKSGKHVSKVSGKTASYEAVYNTVEMANDIFEDILKAIFE